MDRNKPKICIKISDFCDSLNCTDSNKNNSKEIVSYKRKQVSSLYFTDNVIESLNIRMLTLIKVPTF